MIAGSVAALFQGDVNAAANTAVTAIENNLLSPNEYVRRNKLIKKAEESWGSLTEAEARQLVYYIEKDRRSGYFIG